jgi:hypothetical protein
MKAKDLIDINKNTRDLVLNYIKKSGITLNEFCTRAEINYPIMHVFIHQNEDLTRGLMTRTLVKIGKQLQK